MFRFLFRPISQAIVACLAPGGVLVYETFTHEQLALDGGPSNPAFLLGERELPRLFPELEVVAYEEGIFGDEAPTALARLLARKP